MADDILTRLTALNHPDAADACDEIERLRKENAEYERICRKWKAPDGYQIGEMERIALAIHNDKLRTNIRYYQNLVKELLPFMLYDVKCGLELGPASKDHLKFEASNPEGLCSDCTWYKNSLEWKKRIDFGEFGDIHLPE